MNLWRGWGGGVGGSNPSPFVSYSVHTNLPYTVDAVIVTHLPHNLPANLHVALHCLLQVQSLQVGVVNVIAHTC